MVSISVKQREGMKKRLTGTGGMADLADIRSKEKKEESEEEEKEMDYT